MRALAVFAVAALLVAAAAHDFPEEDNVIVLSDDNFEDAVKSFDTLLVEFYAPWCGHCKKLAPEYSKAGATLKKEGLYVAKMDATVNTVTPGQFDVEGFPTLKFFRNGQATDYNGGRTESEIINWIRKKSGPAAKTITTVAEAESFKESAEVTVIGFFKNTDSADAKAFLSAAASLDDVPFAITSESAVATNYGVSSPAIVLFKDFDEGRANFEGEFEVGAIATFVNSNALPLVVPFNQKNAQKIFGGAIKSHLLVFSEEGTSTHDEVMAATRAVAQDVKGKLLTVTVGAGNDRVLQYFGVTKGDQPTAAIVTMPTDGGAMKKFLLGHKNVDKTALSTFTTDFQSGKLVPHLKSEEPPADNSAPVKVIVGKTFNDIALDRSKDVLVEFYAPWCGHCKSLAPIYDELAERFASVKSVVIAKVDATANEVDHPQVNVRGFPTLKFFPAGDRKDTVLDYEGARDLESMTKFIQEKATIKFALADDDSDEL